MSGITRDPQPQQTPRNSDEAAQQHGTNEMVVKTENNERDSLSPLAWSEKTGKPYLAKLWNVEGVYEKLDNETTNNLEFIHSVFQDKVKQSELENEADAYEDFLRRYEKITNTKHAPFHVKLGKIAEFLRYVIRVKRKYGTE